MKKIRVYRCINLQEFHFGRFSLETIQDEDIEDIRGWRNAQIDILRQSGEISPSQQKKYFEDFIWPTMALDNPKNILLTFFENNKRIGYGGMVHISWEHRRAEVSFLLDPVLARDPTAYAVYFSAYLSMIKEFAFSLLNFKRLYTETYDFRKKHIEILESCSFKFEGQMRKHIMIGDKHHDSLIHGIINEK